MDDSDSVDEFVVSSKQVKILEKTKDQVEDRFTVVLTLKRSEEFPFVWIKLRGSLGCIRRGKAYIKALCSPEHQESVDFVDLPQCIVLGFQRFWSNWVEYTCGAVIETGANPSNLKIQGSQLNVTKSVSMLLHLQDLCGKKHQGLKTFPKFDEIVLKCKDPYETDLIGLKSGVKKVLLDMIENAGKNFNASKIRQENMKQFSTPVVFVKPKRSEILSNVFAPHSDIQDNHNNYINDQPMVDLGDSGETSRSSLLSTPVFQRGGGETSSELPNHQLQAQCDFFRHNMKRMGHEERHIDKLLEKHGPNLPVKESVKILNEIREEEEDNALPMLNVRPKKIDTIVISDDETDQVDENDSIIFVSETQASATPSGGSKIFGGPPKTVEKTSKPELPQIMVIEKWIELNYEVTNNDTDFVYKNDLLAKFLNDFNTPKHPDLPNEFFNKLSQSVFDRDPKYSNVKSKGGSGKSAKRRLICIRAKNHPIQPSTSKSTIPDQQQPSNAILKDWINSGNDVTPKSVDVVKPTDTDVRSKDTDVRSKDTDVRSKDTDMRPNMSDVTGRGGDVRSLPAPVFVRPMPGVNRYPGPSYLPPSVGHPMHGAPPFPPRMPPPMHAPFDDVSSMTTRQILDFPKSRDVPGLRPIVIDGSNVACGHGNGRTYSCRGIAICVRYFWARGHREITCFVPNFRKGNKGNPPGADQFVLFELEKRNIAKFTPSRELNGRPVVCYDDRFIVQLAARNGGVIVSNDQYRDLMHQNPGWKHTIETRLLMYAWVDDIFMPPEDPLGRNGPPLDMFLRFERPFNPPPHPNSQGMQPRRFHPMNPNAPLGPSRPHQNRNQGSTPDPERKQLVAELLQIFPGQQKAVSEVVEKNPTTWDLGILASRLLDVQNM